MASTARGKTHLSNRHAVIIFAESVSDCESDLFDLLPGDLFTSHKDLNMHRRLQQLVTCHRREMCLGILIENEVNSIMNCEDRC